MCSAFLFNCIVRFKQTLQMVFDKNTLHVKMNFLVLPVHETKLAYFNVKIQKQFLYVIKQQQIMQQIINYACDKCF